MYIDIYAFVTTLIYKNDLHSSSFLFIICTLLTESDFSEAPPQRGMDRYLDSLFDPVLSDSSGVSIASTL